MEETKKYKNIRINLKEDEISLKNLMKLNKTGMKTQRKHFIVIVVANIIMSFYMVYLAVDSKDMKIALLVGLYMMITGIVMVYYTKGYYKISLMRLKLFTTKLKDKEEVVLDGEDIIFIDDENKMVVFKYNEAVFEVSDIDIFHTKQKDRVEFMDNMYGDMGYGRICNLKVYKSYGLDNKSEK